MNFNINYNQYLGDLEPFADEFRTYIYALRDSKTSFPPQEDPPCIGRRMGMWTKNYDIEYEYKSDVIFISYDESYIHPARFFLKDVIFTNGKMKFICENGATFYIEDDKIVRNICDVPSENFSNYLEQFEGKKSVLENHFTDIEFCNDLQYGWLNEVETYISRYVTECIHDGVTTFIVCEERVEGFIYMGTRSPFPFKYENNGNLCSGETGCQQIPEVKYENKNDIIFYWNGEQRMFHSRLYLKDVIVADNTIMFACENGKLVRVDVEEGIRENDFNFTEILCNDCSDPKEEGVLVEFFDANDGVVRRVYDDEMKNSQTRYNRYKGKQSILAHYLDNVEFRSDMCYGWPHEVDSYITENIIECIHDGVTTFIVPVEATNGLLSIFPC